MPLPAWSHISWLPGGGVRILDQTRLPTEEIYLDLTTIDAMAEAIRLLRVRGAPLIGIAGAMGLTLGGQGGGGAGGQAGGRTETRVPPLSTLLGPWIGCCDAPRA
jgi:hypothetical protein